MNFFWTRKKPEFNAGWAGRFQNLRPTLSHTNFVLLAALWSTLIYPYPFYITLWKAVSENSSIFGCLLLFGLFFALIFLATAFLYSLLFWPYLRKAWLLIFFLCNAAALYNSTALGVHFDQSMIQNIFETTTTEARELIDLPLFLTILILGLLPALYFFSLRIDTRGFFAIRWAKGFILPSGLLVLGVGLGYISQGLYIGYKDKKDALYLIPPTSYITSLLTYSRDKIRAHLPFIYLAQDAKSTLPQGDDRLFVIVVGETGRAKDFSIVGYDKETNPLLKKQPDAVAYPQAYSCWTATARSVPCMFSPYDMHTINFSDAARTENLMDILHTRVKYFVKWLDNDSGCKGVCDRIPTENLWNLTDPRYCRSEWGVCRDEILLEPLQRALKESQGKPSVIVLHQLGSHGPDYYNRYPERFEQFKPACHNQDVLKCTSEELRAEYDNTVLYTDYVLNQVIEILKTQKGRKVAMIYASDHGESLGEGGRYLHGLPRFIAPDEQIHIPFVVWTSDPKLSECLRKKSTEPVSHDFFFHSTLSFMGVETQLYRKEMDLFSGCSK